MSRDQRQDLPPLIIATCVVRTTLLSCVALVASVGITAELARHGLGFDNHELFDLFSLSFERNVPTWFAGIQLGLASAVLFVVAALERRRRAAGRWHWTALALLMLYVSMDEFVSLHERLNGTFDGEGALLFDWVLVAIPVVFVLGLAFLPFLWRLPATTRRGFMLAGGLFVLGAVGMEFPLGLWTEKHGSENLGYVLIDAVEETLEMVGVGLFLSTLLDHMARQFGRVKLLATPMGDR